MESKILEASLRVKANSNRITPATLHRMKLPQELYDIWLSCNQNPMEFVKKISADVRVQFPEFLEDNLQTDYSILGLLYKKFMETRPQKFLDIWNNFKMGNMAQFLVCLDPSTISEFISSLAITQEEFDNSLQAQLPFFASPVVVNRQPSGPPKVRYNKYTSKQAPTQVVNFRPQQPQAQVAFSSRRPGTHAQPFSPRGATGIPKMPTGDKKDVRTIGQLRAILGK